MLIASVTFCISVNKIFVTNYTCCKQYQFTLSINSCSRYIWNRSDFVLLFSWIVSQNFPMNKISTLNENIASLKLLTWSVQLNDVDVSLDCCFPSQIPFLEILRWTVGFFNVVCLAFSCSCNKLQGQFHRPRGLHRFLRRPSSSRRSVPAVHVHSNGVHRLRRGATGTLTALRGSDLQTF